jgi:hypothetical protein
MGISVGDFAEQLMAQDELATKIGSSKATTFQLDPSHYSADITQQAPDISQIEVPDDFVHSITEGKQVEVSLPVVEEDRNGLKEVNPMADKAVDIIIEGMGRILDDVKTTLDEVKTLLTETTTAGMGGVNLANDDEDKNKKDSYAHLLKQYKKNKKK